MIQFNITQCLTISLNTAVYSVVDNRKYS